MISCITYTYALSSLYFLKLKTVTKCNSLITYQMFCNNTMHMKIKKINNAIVTVVKILNCIDCYRNTAYVSIQVRIRHQINKNIWLKVMRLMETNTFCLIKSINMNKFCDICNQFIILPANSIMFFV